MTAEAAAVSSLRPWDRLVFSGAQRVFREDYRGTWEFGLLQRRHRTAGGDKSG